MNNRNRGAFATILNEDTLVAHANSLLPNDDPLKFSGFGRQMLLDTNDGPAVINGEGVGNIPQKDTIAVFLSYGMTLTPVDLPVSVIEAAKTDEKIDLADGIRVFGARLDANHHEWYSRAKRVTTEGAPA